MKGGALLSNVPEEAKMTFPKENDRRLQAQLDKKVAKIEALHDRVSELLDERVSLVDELETRKKEAHEFHSSREYYLNRYRTVRDRLRDAIFENTKLRRENESLREALRDSTDMLECHYTDKEIIAQIRHNREELDEID